MIKRIVKMNFAKGKTQEFLRIFEGRKNDIRNFPGCLSLELGRDNQNDQIFFTISIWENENDLEAYRNSDLFRETWEATKALFEEKARAWSLNIIHNI